MLSFWNSIIYNFCFQECSKCHYSCETCERSGSQGCTSCKSPRAFSSYLHACLPCCEPGKQPSGSCCNCDIKKGKHKFICYQIFIQKLASVLFLFWKGNFLWIRPKKGICFSKFQLIHTLQYSWFLSSYLFYFRLFSLSLFL